MKLVSVKIQNYKCIDDSEEFSIHDLTCLAGKNESGKTALLQALRRLNPVEDSEKEFDELMEYPRRRKHEAKREDSSYREVVTTAWRLSEGDKRTIEDVVGSAVIPDHLIIAQRGYENHTRWLFEFDESKIISFIVSKISELPETSKTTALGYSNLEDLHSYLSSLEEPNQGEDLLLEYIQNNFPENDPKTLLSGLFESLLPRFLYFSDYGTLPGRVHGETIAEMEEDGTIDSDQEDRRYFLALLELAGTRISELLKAQHLEEVKASVEATSNRLSDEIFKYWTQNRNLEVQFNIDEGRPGDPPPFDSGQIFSLRVRNNRHRVSVGFEERSAGFVWFFSFLVWFYNMEEKYDSNLVILLDEPGLNLHGKAQGDLLRFIKNELLPKYQVIYTTHSPFMIDIDNILSVRTVEDVITSEGELQGTKVSDRVLGADADTLFPLRAALGYDITQSLFVGEHCLLVEGPSDLLYLKWFSKQLVEGGDIGLDQRWTITPIGGIDKFGSFNSLFSANKLHVAILTDFHRGDKKKIQGLKDSGLLQAGHILCASDFTDQEEADIEDMLGRQLYIELVNQCYKLKEDKKLPNQCPISASDRVIEEVKQHFKIVATDGPYFDHLPPAVYLLEYGNNVLAKAAEVYLGEALDRFRKLFSKLNSLLT